VKSLGWLSLEKDSRDILVLDEDSNVIGRIPDGINEIKNRGRAFCASRLKIKGMDDIALLVDPRNKFLKMMRGMEIVGTIRARAVDDMFSPLEPEKTAPIRKEI